MATSITNTSISTDTINVDNGVLYVDNNNNRVGVGTASPTAALNVESSSYPYVRVTNTGYTGLDIGQADASEGGAALIKLRDAADMDFYTADLNRMRISSTGNVGIGTGTTDPTAKLEIKDGDLFLNGSTGATDPGILFGDDAGFAVAGGKIWYGNSNGQITYDQYWTSATVSHKFRTQLAGTPVDAMNIYKEGAVTTPQQPHIFGTPHNGTEGSSGQATFFRVKTSRGLSFSNNRITIPVAGVYMITYQTICQSNTGRYDTQVKVNGNEITNGLNENNGDGYHQRTHSFCMYLNVNDYITFHNARYYSNGSQFDPWTTASVTLLG
jgi:hypothetical protein